MTDPVDPTQGIWQSVLTQLTSDDRITPQLHGFISLVAVSYTHLTLPTNREV